MSDLVLSRELLPLSSEETNSWCGSIMLRTMRGNGGVKSQERMATKLTSPLADFPAVVIFITP